jgi:hypothetical protein
MRTVFSQRLKPKGSPEDHAYEIRTAQTKLSEANRRPNFMETVCPSFARLQSTKGVGVAYEPKEGGLQSSLQSHDLRHFQATGPDAPFGGWSPCYIRCAWLAGMGSPSGTLRNIPVQLCGTQLNRRDVSLLAPRRTSRSRPNFGKRPTPRKRPFEVVFGRELFAPHSGAPDEGAG